MNISRLVRVERIIAMQRAAQDKAVGDAMEATIDHIVNVYGLTGLELLESNLERALSDPDAPTPEEESAFIAQLDADLTCRLLMANVWAAIGQALR